MQRSSSKKGTSVERTKAVERPRMPLALALRIFLVGSVAVGASGYALYRHYYIPRPSMLVPAAPVGSGAPEPASSDLLPAPELVPLPTPR